MKQYYGNYRISSSSYRSGTGWTYQTTVEWVEDGLDFNATHWSTEDPFKSAAKAEAVGLAWARSKIDAGGIRGYRTYSEWNSDSKMRRSSSMRCPVSGR